MDSFFVHVAALLLGSTLAGLVYEGVAGNESFSPPLLNIAVVTSLGALLSLWWGWVAVGWVLGVDLTYNLSAGLWERLAPRVGTGQGITLPSPPTTALDEDHGPDAATRRAQALESGRVTDILFRTDRTLLEVAEALHLKGAESDGESYWAWVIGSVGWGTKIDITRTHLRPPSEVDTRLFIVGGGVIGDKLRKTLVERLRPVASGPIRCGQSIYLRGNDFDFVTLEEYP